MRLVVANSFSLSMVEGEKAILKVRKLTLEEAKKIVSVANRTDVEIVSIIGHQDTADIVSDILGVNLPFNRVSFSLPVEDILLVGQYIGPRLPEGATSLPEEASIKFILVEYA